MKKRSGDDDIYKNVDPNYLNFIDSEIHRMFRRVAQLSQKAQDNFAAIVEKQDEYDPRHIGALYRALLSGEPNNLVLEHLIAHILNLLDVIDKGTKDFKPEGDFGYTMTNPIMARGVTAANNYLESLECDDGDKIRYERHGAFDAHSYGLSQPMDGFHIYNKKTGEEIAFIYLYEYSHETSKVAPEGFRFKRNFRRK